MGTPQPTTVRGWLAALWTLLTGWQNNTTAVVEEIRFLQRNMFGYDSTGATQPFSFLNVVSFALYPGGLNAAGEPTTHSIGEILSREFGDFTQYRVEFWLTEIRSVMRRIELHLLPSSSEPFAPGQLSELREAVNALRFSSGFPTAQDASLADIWQRLGALEALMLADTVENTAQEVATRTLLGAYLKCLQEELAPNCNDVPGGDFPPVDPECIDVGEVVAFIYPVANTGSVVDTWDVQIEPGVTLWGAVDLGGSDGLQYLGVGANELRFSVQTVAGFTIGTGAGWGFSPVFTSPPFEPSSRPSVDINSFSNCTTDGTFYEESAGSEPFPIAYAPQFDTGSGGTSPAAGTFRIACIQTVA